MIMERFFESLLAGILQGLAEFFPISSSGHLLLVQNFLNFENLFFFTVVIHFGTLLSLIVFYRSTWIKIFKDSITDLKNSLLLKIGISFIPSVFVGFLFYESIKKIFVESNYVFFGFILTGIVLVGTYSLLEKNKKPLNSKEGICISYLQAFLVGFFQIFSFIPGVSRSGITISTGLYLGMSPLSSLHFSFLLAAPTLAGAFILELMNNSIENIEWTYLIVGFLSSFLFGYLALHLMKAWIYYLYRFGFYLLLLGFIFLLYPV